MAGRVAAWRRIAVHGLLNIAQHGFELLLLVVCMFSGAAGLLDPESVASSPISTLFPAALATVWYAGLWISGLVAIIGIFMTSPVGRQVEMAGLLALSGLMVSISLLLLRYSPQVLLPSMSLAAVLVAAIGFRIWLIRREPRVISQAIELIRSVDAEAARAHSVSDGGER